MSQNYPESLWFTSELIRLTFWVCVSCHQQCMHSWCMLTVKQTHRAFDLSPVLPHMSQAVRCQALRQTPSQSDLKEICKIGSDKLSFHFFVSIFKEEVWHFTSCKTSSTMSDTQWQHCHWNKLTNYETLHNKQQQQTVLPLLCLHVWRRSLTFHKL